MRLRRVILMVLTSMLAAATVLWIQGRFEHADERNAVGIVQQYRSRAGVTLPQLLSHKHPGRPVQWRSHMRSSCFQHIEVIAAVAEKPGVVPTEYAFAVDLNGPSIHPANEAGAALLGQMDTPLPKPSPTSSTTATSSAAAAAPQAYGSNKTAAPALSANEATP